DRCGEGAVWDASEEALYWCDIFRFLVHRYDQTTGAVRSWLFDEPVVAVALTTRPGELLVALGSRLVLWQPIGDERADLGYRLPGYPGVRLNDGRPDPAGRFWVGSMQNNVKPDGDLDLSVEGHFARPGRGILVRIEADGSHEVLRSRIGISNTVCWSPDGRTFYFGDTLENEIRAFDFDAANGTIGNDRPFLAGFARGNPDGSTVDSEGYLWNCRFGGGCIVRVAPDGRIDRVIDLPATDITTCTFGGPDLKTLFVTSANMRQHPGERLAGSLFALSCDVPGLAENRAAIRAPSSAR
ncbi:MAG: SMP-30/gluconolactonase/LRE family protein, partial [Ancalomicrobiaceae bacterium]|nr:SMP-30/gluconolactonase/LRE family protein [Ancalomicrobiaceae bacterium]